MLALRIFWVRDRPNECLLVILLWHVVAFSVRVLGDPSDQIWELSVVISRLWWVKRRTAVLSFRVWSTMTRIDGAFGSARVGDLCIRSFLALRELR